MIRLSCPCLDFQEVLLTRSSQLSLVQDAEHSHAGVATGSSLVFPRYNQAVDESNARNEDAAGCIAPFASCRT